MPLRINGLSALPAGGWTGILHQRCVARKRFWSATRTRRSKWRATAMV